MILKLNLSKESWIPFLTSLLKSFCKVKILHLISTLLRPQLLFSSKKTKASYAITSNVPNIRPSFPLQTSNSFQVLSPNFSPLQPSKSFIQASKSTSKSISVQSQSNLSTISILTSSSFLPNSQNVRKPKTLEIAFIEPKFNFEEIPKILSYIFPRWVNFNSNDPLKTHPFYEFILVDTSSVEITHNIDKNNPQRIAFSKCQILSVMTIAD